MKLLQALPKIALGLVLASGITGAVAASAKPADAGVVISVGFGGGYAPAPAYRWYRWHDGYGWHRRWAVVGWAPPVAYGPPVAYYGPAYGYGYGYGRPAYGAVRYSEGYGHHDRWADRGRWGDRRR